MNARELIEFNRVHGGAAGFIMAATDDYIACRCCLLNGLFPGLRLGAEAVEKYLKAFILYRHPSVNVEKKYHHRIKKVASDASLLAPRFNALQFSQVFERLETHYRNRYPDVTNFTREASPAELVGIDEAVLHICECLPIPEVPKFRNYGPFFFVCCNWIPSVPAYANWLEQGNLAIQRVKPLLLQRYRAMEKEIENS
jgi:hypothetical protein